MPTSVKSTISGTPDDSIRLLEASNTPEPTNGTTANVAIKTYTLPAGTMGPNDSISIEFMFSKTGTAGTYNSKVRFGAATEVFIRNGAGGTNISGNFKSVISNNNSTSSQKFMGKGLDDHYIRSTTTAMETSAVDTTADVDIEFVAWCGDAADTMILESYRITLIKGS